LRSGPAVASLNSLRQNRACHGFMRLACLCARRARPIRSRYGMDTFASVFLGFFMNVAKLFTHGGSQAVRLPKEFRFEGTEVHVRRVGNEVVLSAQPPADLQTLLDALEGFEAGVRLRREQPAAQSRAAIKPRR
jgi:antitoxin VapB